MLPPTAVAVDDSMGVAAAAVPVTAFVYKDQDYKQHVLMVEADLPVAPILPQYQSTGM